MYYYYFFCLQQVTNEWVNDNPELPSPPNMILTHIVYRLIDLVKPPEVSNTCTCCIVTYMYSLSLSLSLSLSRSSLPPILLPCQSFISKVHSLVSRSLERLQHSNTSRTVRHMLIAMMHFKVHTYMWCILSG